MPVSSRLVSLDAFRGFVMLLMASSGFGLAQMAKTQPDSWLWQQVAFHVSHVPWAGCALWDLIQPSFMFMVGVAVPLSVRRRREEGQGFFGLGAHALLRAVLLILLAVLLTTRAGDGMTRWEFPNVLAQIGLGYVFLVLIAGLGWEYCLAAILVILSGYWVWFFSIRCPRWSRWLPSKGLNLRRKVSCRAFLPTGTFIPMRRRTWIAGC